MEHNPKLGSIAVALCRVLSGLWQMKAWEVRDGLPDRRSVLSAQMSVTMTEPATSIARHLRADRLHRASFWVASALLLAAVQAARGAEVWPEPVVTAVPAPEGPRYHPQGALFVVSSRSFLLQSPQDLEGLVEAERTSAQARQSVISDLVRRKRLAILDAGRVLLALKEFASGRGLVHDEVYGDRFLMMDYGAEFQAPIRLEGPVIEAPFRLDPIGGFLRGVGPEPWFPPLIQWLGFDRHGAIAFPGQAEPPDPAAELWPAPSRPTIPGIGNPLDRERGERIDIFGRGLFFRERAALEEYEAVEDTSEQERDRIIEELKRTNEVSVLEYDRHPVAIGPFWSGRGRVHDEYLGDGYLVLNGDKLILSPVQGSPKAR